MRAAAIIVAAGASRRFGSSTPKQFIPLQGKPLFLWSILAFKKVKDIRQIILVVPQDKLTGLASTARRYGITLVAGGRERIDSVKAGLSSLHDGIDFVAIHDGARPLITPQQLRVYFSAAMRHKAIIPAVPVQDTVKLTDSWLTIEKTIPREQVWRAQTPQIFKRSLLEKAYAALKSRTVTDDAQVMELSGNKVTVVPGDPHNIKITEQRDLQLAKFYLKHRS